LHSGHTRRLIARLSLVAIAFVVATQFGCSDDAGPYGMVGLGGIGGGGSGGSDTGGADGPGTGGSDAGTTGSSGAGGPGGSVGASGGNGGSIGGAGGDGGGGSGPGGSIGGSGTGAAGTTGTGGTGAVTAQPWPGSANVIAVDSMYQFSKNLSDLVYEPTAGNDGDVLWGLMNSPPTLFCLLWNGTTWSGMTDDGWTADQAFAEMKKYQFGMDFLHPEFKKFVYQFRPAANPAPPAVVATQVVH